MSLEEADIRCQIAWQLDQNKKYDEVVAHVLTGCLSCVTNPKKRFGGREMLFPNEPPPWIKVPESEKSNPEAWKRFHKKKMRSEMTLEEFEQFLVDSDLSDAQLAMEIAKFRRIEKVASWTHVRDIRRKQKEKRLEQEKKEKEAKKLNLEAKKEAEKLKKQDEKRKNLEEKQLKDDEKLEYLEKMKEDEKLLEENLDEEIKDEQSAENEEKSKKSERKEFNLRKDMPWSPSTYDFLCTDKRSIIDQSQQKRMIAMCQSLMYEGQLRHSGNRDELKPAPKTRLLDDSIAHDLISSCKQTTVLSDATTICHLLSPNWESRDYEFGIPIRVKIQRVDGVDKKCVTMSKPVPSTSLQMVQNTSGTKTIVDPSDLQLPPENQRKNYAFDNTKSAAGPSNQHGKKEWQAEKERRRQKMLKKQQKQKELDSIKDGEKKSWQKFNTKANAKGLKGLKKVTVSGSAQDGSSTGDKRGTVISKATIQRKTLKRALKNQYLKRMPLKKSQKRTQDELMSSEEASFQESQESTAPTTSSESLLDSMLLEMKMSDQKFASSKSDEIPENSEDLAYQYAIFRIGDARILIRSNGAHLLNEQGDKKRQILENCRKVTFEPRIEYLSNGGAMEIGAAEWVWNYTKAVFKTSQSHVIYRTNYRLDHVLQIDPLSMRIDKQQPPPDALGILSARCVMLERMIAQLEQLEPGEYCAVQERDRPLIVVPKCSADQRGGVSLGASLTRDDCKRTTDSWKDDDFFHGFCRDVALQWQIVQGRAPQLLLAKDSAINAQMPSKMNRNQFQRKKTSMKRKFAQKEAEKEDAKRQKALDLDDPNLYADFTNPSILPQDFVKPKLKNFNSFRGGGRGGGPRGRPRARGRGAFRGGGGGAGGGGVGSGPSTSDSVPAIP
ncbi:Protein CBG11726 [Caenorhabditis briggsae]|uniref:Protein CBG11726 n=1 Tax=Caenorhabditis briggsae TaxID=6238 RepID=A8XDV7_CAEBR|nr:Protein CBG11726 [Caenorhabditis briggsae]CAP30852.2 Protein CBG11726 [Caenorhabditis briggsae]